MTQARKTLIRSEITPYYHCISRCVRRAHLCGKDKFTGQDFSHRRAWIKKRLAKLSNVFAIDICAYAIMSNHLHLVLKLSPKQSQKWCYAEIARRWGKLFRVPDIIKNFLNQELSEREERLAVNILEKWRGRLSSISWLMKCVNEPLARMANKEDGVTGRFWEGRFKSQALLDESSVLACMVYVDLNPIRAGLAKSLNTSDFSSIQQRLREKARKVNVKPVGGSVKLLVIDDRTFGLSLDSYVELVQWTGRGIRDKSQSYIAGTMSKTLRELGVEPKMWLPTMLRFEKYFLGFVGKSSSLSCYKKQTKKDVLRGGKRCQEFFLESA